MVTSSDIQHTRLKGEKQFQAFCLKLIRRYWKDDYAQLHGRRGQGQQGADITGSDKRNGHRRAAVQCKGSETNDPRKFDEGELVQEVNKAKGFEPKLDILIVAYAGDRDGELQKKAIALDDENAMEGLFRVVLWSWDDIVERAIDFPDVIEELLVQNKVLTTAALDPKRPTSSSTAAMEAAVKSAIAVYHSALPAEASAISNGDPIAEAKIDVLRDQIQAGNGSIVVESLRELIRSLGETADPHVRFRAHANLGAALVQQGQIEHAVVAFDEAADAKPGTAASHAYKARAALFRDKVDQAYIEANTALHLDPNQQLAALCFVKAAPKEIKTKEIEERLQVLTIEIDIAAELSRRYSDDGAHGDALRIAREVSTHSWQRDTIIAQAILHRFESNLEARIGAPLNDVDANLVEEARDLLERAWQHAKKRGDRKSWIHVAANLCSAYRLTGQDEEGDSIAIEAYGIAPESSPIIKCAALAYLHRGDLPKANLLASGLAESGGIEEALLAATISALAADWTSVHKWAHKGLEDINTDDDSKARAAELVVLAIHKTAATDEALKEADKLRERFAPSVTFEGRVAEIARRLGNEEAIQKSRERLANFDVAKLNAVERFELADAFGDDGNWERAAKLLEVLHSLERPSEILKRRLFALHRADLRAQARDLYRSLQAGALRSKEIRRLGAAIYERSGMLPEASKELSAALELDPSDLRSRLDWARLCIRSNNERRVSRWVKNASTNVEGEPEAILELAQLMDRYGRRKDALKLGYQTLLRYWGHSERLHMMFMSLFFLHTKRDAFLETKVVTEDTVVFLENEHGTRTRYRIENGMEPAPDLLSPGHQFAIQLRGTKVDDTIVQSQGIGQPTTWKVIDIKHKYIDLFHRVLASHDTAFPGSRTLGHFHIDTRNSDAFEPIFEQARERAKLVKEASKLYKESVIPVDTVGNMLGVDGIDASRGLRFHSHIPLDNCLGTNEERQLILNCFTDVTKIMVDPLTLSLWQEIGLLPILGKITDLQVEVVQATIDTLAARAEEARNAVRQKGGSLEVRGEAFALIEPTKAERRAYADSCDDLLAWCRDHAAVVPTEKLKGLEGHNVEQMLSEASIDTLGTAIEAKSAVVIEDRRLRALGVELGIERASWTQPFLMTLRARNKLSHELYVSLTAKLDRNRIGFVTVANDDLSVAANLGAMSEEFMALADALARSNVDARTLVPVSVQFVTVLWADSNKKLVRDRLTSEILERLLRRPDSFKLYRIILRSVYAKLRELNYPEYFNEKLWSDYVENFVTGHFIKRGLLAKE